MLALNLSNKNNEPSPYKCFTGATVAIVTIAFLRQQGLGGKETVQTVQDGTHIALGGELR